MTTRPPLSISSAAGVDSPPLSTNGDDIGAYNLSGFLAQGLEESEEPTFTSRHRMAGTPWPDVANNGSGRFFAYGGDVPCISSPQPQSLLSGTHILGAIQEQHSMNQIAPERNFRIPEDRSEGSSIDSTLVNSLTSSIPFRGQCMAANGTSVVPGRLKRLFKPERIIEGTWMDFDPDTHDDCGQGLGPEDVRFSRPVVSRGDSGIEIFSTSPASFKPSDDWIPANSGGSPKLVPKATIPIPEKNPARHLRVTSDTEAYAPRVYGSSRRRLKREYTLDSTRSTTYGNLATCSESLVVPSQTSCALPGRVKEALRIDLPEEQEVHTEAPGRGPFCPTAATSQGWLEANLVHSPVSHDDSEELPFAGLPLPQSVINTLKISTLYFPDTMLLSSSLSIETIRSYSRKLRQPESRIPASHDCCPWSPPPSPPENSKKRFWPVFHRKGAQQSLNTQQFHGNYARISRPRTPDPPYSKAKAASTGSLKRSNWAPFSNIFATGSDHLCDALYAHIIAYNYVSCLVGRVVRPAEVERPKSSYVSRPSQESVEAVKIPKKAATLLGLSYIASEEPLSAEERGSEEREKEQPKRGTASRLAHEPGSRPSAEIRRETDSLRELQDGLAGCIAKLVAALQQGEAGEIGTGSLVQGATAPDIDPIFLRALCEIVRCVEGSCTRFR